jgi:hypothetical protein
MVTSHKSISDENSNRDHAQRPSLRPYQGEGGTAATVIEKVICNRWEINPEYEKVFS